MAHQIQGPVHVRNGDHLAAHIVAEAVQGGGEDEAVADPEARLHRLVEFAFFGVGWGILLTQSVGALSFGGSNELCAQPYH
jgi:hypothetical protein